jgi:hypothetical protein
MIAGFFPCLLLPTLFFARFGWLVYFSLLGSPLAVAHAAATLLGQHKT